MGEADLLDAGELVLLDVLLVAGGLVLLGEREAVRMIWRQKCNFRINRALND